MFGEGDLNLLERMKVITVKKMVSFRLSDDCIKWLVCLSRKYDRSQAAIIEDLINWYLVSVNMFSHDPDEIFQNKIKKHWNKY